MSTESKRSSSSSVTQVAVLDAHVRMVGEALAQRLHAGRRHVAGDDLAPLLIARGDGPEAGAHLEDAVAETGTAQLRDP